MVTGASSPDKPTALRLQATAGTPAGFKGRRQKPRSERRKLKLPVVIRRRPGLIVAMKFRVHIETDEDGVFVAECPTLPGCISQGATRQEAVANIKDAIAGYLTSLEKHGEAVPLPMNEEVVEVTG